MKDRQFERILRDVLRLKNEGITDQEISDSFNDSNVPCPFWTPEMVQRCESFAKKLWKTTLSRVAQGD